MLIAVISRKGHYHHDHPLSDTKYNKGEPGRRTCSTDKMHGCALGREGGPSAPRVEHRYKIAKIATGPKTSGKRD